MRYDSVDQLPKHLQDQAKKKLAPKSAGDNTNLPGTPAGPGASKPSKYSNIKTEVDNIIFDSRAEARRYGVLQLQQAAGLISNLRLQPVYVLQDRFKDHTGKTHRAITFIADFEYMDLETGQLIVEDVKGMETNVFKLKKKLFIKQNPDKVLRVLSSREA